MVLCPLWLPKCKLQYEIDFVGNDLHVYGNIDFEQIKCYWMHSHYINILKGCHVLYKDYQ